jgi:hypothetical protein
MKEPVVISGVRTPVWRCIGALKKGEGAGLERL